ncbi:ATP-binding protein [Flavobacterium hungaricum]|uniref:ATP-binding protein n=1 Tax=Flavobacterium hungaricum TaxID=2082725 RepID=A0ABR9TNK8_9FLAO|nr:ATP-binding protein [Flavobacterium hungaricum]MBE8726960.1 ATP-binding protein [Flavobacterium hungaricum]
MTITIPNDIRSEFEGYNYIITWINKYKNVKNTEIIFDFGRVTFLEANLCALIGTIFEMLESNNNIISIINIQPQVETILRKNEFLLPFGFNKITDYNDTVLRYRKFTPTDDLGFNNYIHNELLNKRQFPSHSEKLGKEITRNIFEIYENARTHGQCDYIHSCGQFYPNKLNKPLYFTIVDKGVNIKQNVSAFFNQDIDAANAIEWAMKKGNTTKSGDTSGGLGLAVIFEFIKHNKGKIQIISSNGFYEYKNENTTKRKLTTIFEGTIVNIKFNLNDSNYYSLVNEEEDFENIF